MKKIVFVLTTVLAVTLLASCEVTGPHVKLKPPITVEGDHHDGDHDGHHSDNQDGDFCPPGQAKKGRC
ncbi:MAG TPA: hypothetical protein PK031_06860 [Pseudomonadales bacterium]|nr:hypothetical protein [Pseudomonadales bacterium]